MTGHRQHLLQQQQEILALLRVYLAPSDIMILDQKIPNKYLNFEGHKHHQITNEIRFAEGEAQEPIS